MSVQAFSAMHDSLRFPDFFDQQFIITDGVVVWRAWVICSDLNKAILMTPVVILALDGRTPTCLLSPSVLIQTIPSRLLDYGRSEGWGAHYSRGGSDP